MKPTLSIEALSPTTARVTVSHDGNVESWEVEMEGEAPYRTVDGPRELYHRLLAHGMLSEGYRLAGEAMIAFGEAEKVKAS